MTPPTRDVILRAVRGSALGVVMFLSMGCRPPTEVTLELTTDVKCSDLRATSITVGLLGEIETKPPLTSTTQCEADGRIGSFVLTPSGAKDAEVGVRIVVGVAESPDQCVADGYTGGCIVARRSLRYLPHTPIDLPIPMTVDCLNIPCDSTSTCAQGSCRPAENFSPDAGAVDAGAVDGGDSGADAGTGGIQWISNSTNTTPIPMSSGTFIVITPGNPQMGDLFWLNLYTDGTTTGVVPPMGWTPGPTIVTDPVGNYQLHQFYRFAGSSEPTSYNFGIVSPPLICVSGVLDVYRGVDPTNPIDAQGETVGNMYAAPSIAATRAPGLLLLSYVSNQGRGVTWTAPAGMTDRGDSGYVFVADAPLLTTGLTGVRIASNTVALMQRIGIVTTVLAAQ